MYVNLYFIYNVCLGNLYVVQKWYNQMEKNGIILVVYFFIKSLVLYVGYVCVDLEGKEVGKGEGMGWIFLGKKIFKFIQYNVYI